MSAGRNPVTVKPATKELTNQNMPAFSMNIKSPNVRMVTGSVRITNIGRTIRLSSPRMMATISAVYRLSTCMPGTKCETSNNAAAAISIFPSNLYIRRYYTKNTHNTSCRVTEASYVCSMHSVPLEALLRYNLRRMCVLLYNVRI